MKQLIFLAQPSTAEPHCEVPQVVVTVVPPDNPNARSCHALAVLHSQHCTPAFLLNNALYTHPARHCQMVCDTSLCISLASVAQCS